MTERKFTPPTSFPAEYVDGNGNKAVIFGRGPHEMFPFIGYDFEGTNTTWTEEGRFILRGRTGFYDLHDIPKRIITWHNVYAKWIGGSCSSRRKADDMAGNDNRLCVYRISRNEDGLDPEIFVEKVEDFKEEV